MCNLHLLALPYLYKYHELEHMMMQQNMHADSVFVRFHQDNGAVMRLEVGATATVVNTRFQYNFATSDDLADPVAFLSCNKESDAAAIWFQNCLFQDQLGVREYFGLQESLSNQGATGDVSVENSHCRVYSDTVRPTVWDVELGQSFTPWFLVSSGEESHWFDHNFEETSPHRRDIPFPTEADNFYIIATKVSSTHPKNKLHCLEHKHKLVSCCTHVQDQATATGLPAVTPVEVQDRNVRFTVTEPHPTDALPVTRSLSTGAIYGIAVACSLLLLAAAVAAPLWWRRRVSSARKHSVVADVWPCPTNFHMPFPCSYPVPPCLSYRDPTFPGVCVELAIQCVLL